MHTKDWKLFYALTLWVSLVFNMSVFNFCIQWLFHGHSFIKQLFIGCYYIPDPENREYIFEIILNILNLNHIFNLQSVLISLGT